MQEANRGDDAIEALVEILNTRALPLTEDETNFIISLSADEGFAKDFEELTPEEQKRALELSDRLNAIIEKANEGR